MLNLDRERFADALGIAGTFTGGIWAFLADGAMTKRFHPGKAPRTGLSAALLAQAGMTGPRQVLEAEWGGFFSTYARGIATPEATLEGLGTEFRIARSGMKPYACCRGLHATIDALFELMRETGVDSRAYRAHDRARQRRSTRVQFDRPRDRNLLDAQFSMQYALAVGADSGRATLDQFAPLRTSEPEIRSAHGRHEVAADRDAVKPGDYPPLEFALHGRPRASSGTSQFAQRRAGESAVRRRAAREGRVADRPGAGRGALCRAARRRGRSNSFPMRECS